MASLRQSILLLPKGLYLKTRENYLGVSSIERISRLDLTLVKLI